MDNSQGGLGVSKVSNGQINISWSQELTPLARPSTYSYSAGGNENFGAISWHTWCVESHLERLYDQCNKLLSRIEAHEQLLLKIIN